MHMHMYFYVFVFMSLILYLMKIDNKCIVLYCKAEMVNVKNSYKGYKAAHHVAIYWS